MRVLAVGNRSPSSAAGGYERIFAGTVAALAAAGHDVRVLTPPELRWYWRDGDFVRPPWREVARIERHNAAVLRRALAGADVVSWWGMGGMSLSLVERVRRAGVPAVGVVGDGWMVYGPGADAWTRLRRRVPVLDAPDLSGTRWLFISEAVRARAPVGGGVVRPGVDPAAFPYRAAGPRALSPGLPSRRWWVR